MRKGMRGDYEKRDGGNCEKKDTGRTIGKEMGGGL